MKLAYVGPLSPLKTGVSHFSENLLPFLAERCEIKLFTDAHPLASTPILRRFAAAPISALASEAEAFDAILYHMGNHYRFHRRVFEALLRFPGVVVLHDCVLNQFFAKYALERGNFGVFRRLFECCYADLGSEEIHRFFEQRGDPYRYPMAGVIAMCSRGTIVMSDYGRGIVREEAPDAEVLRVSFPHFRSGGSSEPDDVVRREFGIAQGCFVVTSIGHMAPAKRIDVAIEAFRRFNEKFPNSVFLLAGDESPRLSVSEMIAAGSLKNASYLGYLPRADLDGLVQVSDACINLRYPSNGEMSASLLDMFGSGKAVAVSDYAQFAEFPDDICVKIGLGPNEVECLADELLDLARNEDRRFRIGEAAKKHVRRHHRPEDVAEAILRFAEAQSKSEPILARSEIDDLLLSDGLPRRLRQMIAYNARRLAGYCRERGVIGTARQALKRAFDRTA